LRDRGAICRSPPRRLSSSRRWHRRVLAGVSAWPVAQLLHKLPLLNVTLNERLAVAVPLCLAMLAIVTIEAGRGG
jgi:hypothetical protein